MAKISKRHHTAGKPGIPHPKVQQNAEDTRYALTYTSWKEAATLAVQR